MNGQLIAKTGDSGALSLPLSTQSLRGLALFSHVQPCNSRLSGQHLLRECGGVRRTRSRMIQEVIPQAGGGYSRERMSTSAIRANRIGALLDTKRERMAQSGISADSGAVEAGPAEHADWMRAIAEERSRAAFARLFAHFAPRIKAYLMRSGSDEGGAEELVQEAMLTVWRRAESFDVKQASVATWMFTIARNKRIDACRRTKRPELDPQDPALAPQPEPMQDDSVGEGETADAIREAIATLPDEQAEMLRLAFFEDMAHSEIAEHTGLPLGTVKSRLRLAITKMRGLVDEELK